MHPDPQHLPRWLKNTRMKERKHEIKETNDTFWCNSSRSTKLINQLQMFPKRNATPQKPANSVFVSACVSLTDFDFDPVSFYSEGV